MKIENNIVRCWLNEYAGIEEHLQAYAKHGVIICNHLREPKIED